MSIFHFDGFCLQTARPFENYKKLAQEWTDADAYHKHSTDGGFWFEQDSGIESYILEDKFGVVFFFKMQRHPHDEVELHIQFPPPAQDPRTEAGRRDRVMRGLTLGLEWIEKVLALKEVSTLFFVSQNPSLIRFCEKRLGFTRAKKRLVKPIAQPKGDARAATNGN